MGGLLSFQPYPYISDFARFIEENGFNPNSLKFIDEQPEEGSKGRTGRGPEDGGPNKAGDNKNVLRPEKVGGGAMSLIEVSHGPRKLSNSCQGDEPANLGRAAADSPGREVPGVQQRPSYSFLSDFP